jgi:hypothetical protein
VSSYEHGNEPSDTIKGGEFLAERLLASQKDSVELVAVFNKE